jgi:UDP-N-acetylmuramyl pentapeptide phosphotransferase/UDP-N-acetylglucosamine-1-phosphate transferase
LLFNFAPASVFMGDVGSVFLGAGCGALTAAAISRGYLSIVSGVFFMFPFVFDATFTLFRRAARGEKVWLPHRSHIYQTLCALGVSHRDVSILYTTAAVAFASVGLRYDALPSAWQTGALLGIPAACGLLAFLVLRSSAQSGA